MKKQSQLWTGKIGVSYYVKGDYEEIHVFKSAEKQSQFDGLWSEMRDSVDSYAPYRYVIAEMDFRFLTLLCNFLMVLLL